MYFQFMLAVDYFNIVLFVRLYTFVTTFVPALNIHCKFQRRHQECVDRSDCRADRRLQHEYDFISACQFDGLKCTDLC
jgi:hypothetical protein